MEIQTYVDEYAWIQFTHPTASKHMSTLMYVLYISQVANCEKLHWSVEIST